MRQHNVPNWRDPGPTWKCVDCGAILAVRDCLAGCSGPAPTPVGDAYARASDRVNRDQVARDEVAAAAEPNPDEVRQALALMERNSDVVGEPTRRLADAARAWLELREQQPAEPTPTIAQVIEACAGQYLSVGFTANEGWWARVEAIQVNGAAEPEFAIRKLYDDARSQLISQRDEAIAKLAKLDQQLEER